MHQIYKVDFSEEEEDYALEFAKGAQESKVHTDQLQHSGGSGQSGLKQRNKERNRRTHKDDGEHDHVTTVAVPKLDDSRVKPDEAHEMRADQTAAALRIGPSGQTTCGLQAKVAGPPLSAYDSKMALSTESLPDNDPITLSPKRLEGAYTPVVLPATSPPETTPVLSNPRPGTSEYSARARPAFHRKHVRHNHKEDLYQQLRRA